MNRTTSAALCLAVLAAAASCSLKEDRTDCPCWLNLNLERCRTVPDASGAMKPVGWVEVAAWSDRPLFTGKVGHQDFGEAYERAVPKGYVTTSAVTGREDMVQEGSRLLIPEGKDADELFAHARDVACYGEEMTDTVRLHKQFARVLVKVENPVGEDYPYTFRLRGEVCGMDLRSLLPVEGKMEMDLDRDGEDLMRFNLPRQTEGSLIRLDILKDGEVQETLPLDEWIRRLGYDWLARDLRDISINVDYAKGQVSVSVNGWTDGGRIDIIL